MPSTVSEEATLTQASMPAERTLGGRYFIEAPLAEGGMARVYRGKHIRLDEPIAIKLLKEEFLDNREAVARFLQEARTGARLRGEHVAQVLDIGKTSAGVPYIVTELLEGYDLRHLIERGIRLSPERVIEIHIGACRAVAEVHRHNIVHRDLKPSNIFLVCNQSGAESVKLLDFGVAKRLGSQAKLTKTERSLGSPHYMSPEQFTAPGDVDMRADVWSLGVVLFELLTGKVPFDGPTVTAICASIIGQQPKPPSSIDRNIDPALDAIVLRCLEKDRERRLQSATELEKALATFRDRSWRRSSSLADIGLGATLSATAAQTPEAPVVAAHAEHADEVVTVPVIEQSSAGSASGAPPKQAKRRGGPHQSRGALVVAMAALVVGATLIATNAPRVRAGWHSARSQLESTVGSWFPTRGGPAQVRDRAQAPTSETREKQAQAMPPIREPAVEIQISESHSGQKNARVVKPRRPVPQQQPLPPSLKVPDYALEAPRSQTRFRPRFDGEPDVVQRRYGLPEP